MKFLIFIFVWIPISAQCDENIGNILVKKTQSFAGEISELPHDSYYEFLQNSDTVVDRTLLLQTLCMDLYGILYNKTAVISAPRFFGKTTNLQMLEFFFKAELDENGLLIDPKQTKAYRFFVEGSIIAKNGRVDDFDKAPLISKQKDFIEEHLARYPVIHLDFINMQTVIKFEDFLNEFKDITSRACQKYQPAIVNLCEKNWNSRGVNFTRIACLSTDYETYINARDKQENEPFKLIYSLQFLCQYVEKYFGQPVVVLIDNVDSLFTKFYANEKFTVTLKQRNLAEYFFLEFIDSVLNDEHLYLGVLCGVLPFLLKTILSGKPDIQYFRYTNRDFHPYYGFTVNEVEQLFKLREISQAAAEDARLMYYGYSMEEDPSIKAYNPWSIVKFYNTKRMNFYWIREGPYSDLAANLLKSLKIKDTLTQLLADKYVECRPVPPIHMYHFAELETLLHEGENSDKFTNYTLGIQHWFLWLSNADGSLVVESTQNGSYYTKIPTTENREGLIALSLNRKLKFREGLLAGNSTLKEVPVIA